ncbi:nitroreductase family protein [Lactobacillaceae bacterium L1_55_11]|nr:nitroreductase family protein [Lactobacillaceae bacterium L1_55_11]
MDNHILNHLRAHQSIRAFTDQPVTDEQVAEIITAATAGPNFQNYQPVTFIEITDQKIKAEISEIVGMKYIETATRFFVVTVDFNKDLIGLDEAQRKMAIEKISHYQMLEGGVVSAAIALGRAQIAAEALGLGTVTMAGVMRAYEVYERELDLPQLVKPVMGFSLGYPDQNPGIKPKLPLAGSLMEGKYDQAQMESAVDEYNQTMRSYYKTRGMDKDWTEHNLGLFAKANPSSELTEYVQRKGFNLK